MSRRQPGDTSPLEQNVLACCYALIGLAVATRLAVRWFDRQVDNAVMFGTGIR